MIFRIDKTIGGVERPGLAAVDVRTLRLLPFSPALPEGTDEITDIAASSSSVYVAYTTYPSANDGPEVRAFDLRTGAMLRSFHVTEFTDGVLSAIVYAGGKVIIAGSTRLDRGHPVVAYDAATGRPVWQVRPGWSASGATTDGSRVFVGVPGWIRGHELVAAFDVATGKSIPGWGKSLVARSWDGIVYGVDATRVFGARRADPRPFAVTRADGRPVSLPHLPAGAFRLYYGTRRTILGVHLAPSGAHIYALYSSSGKLVGTVCSRYSSLALRDDRHVIVADSILDPGRSTLFLLARPR